MLVQIFGGQKPGKYPAVLLEDGPLRHIVRSSTSSDADDVVFSPGFVEVNGHDFAGSTSSLASEQPSDGSTDSATPYDARADLRCSDVRSSASRNGVDRQETVPRERRRRVNRTCSDNQTPCSRQKRLVRRIRRRHHHHHHHHIIMYISEALVKKTPAPRPDIYDQPTSIS